MRPEANRTPRAVAPALVLLAAAALGIAAAHWSLSPKPLWAAALLAASIAYGRRTGFAVLFAAAGYLIVAAREMNPPPFGIPLEARVEVISPWRSGAEGDAQVRANARLLSWRRAYPRGASYPGGPAGAGELELVVEVPRAAVEGDRGRDDGSILRVRGELRPRTRFLNRRPVVVGAERLVVKSASWIETERRPMLLASLRNRLRQVIDRRLPPTPASRSSGLALARALTLGDGRGLSTDTWRALRQSGLAHLVAVSGFNVAVLVGALWFLAWAAGARRHGRHVVAVLGALAYLLVLGDQPSAARATTSAALVAAAFLLGRLPWAPQLLGFAGLLLLMVDDRWLFDLSFQLTFAATAGLLLGAPHIARRLAEGGVPVVVAHAVSVGVAAQLATSPWILGQFHTWVGGGLVWNLIAAPWSAVVFLVSFAAVGLRGWWSWLDDRVRAALDFLAWPVEWLSEQPPIWGTSPWAGSSFWAWVGALALGAALWAPTDRRIRGGLAIVGLLSWLLASGQVPSLLGGARDDVRAVFFDVGQGDATLLLGDGAILIDGGGWPQGDFGGRVLVPALAAEGVRRLDAAFLSHFDQDHCQGLLDLAAWMPIDDVWTGPSWEGSACARALRARARRRVGTVVAGDRRAYGAWNLEVLSPDLRDLSRFAGLGSNDSSLALSASAAGRRLMLLGDLERKGEQWLVFRAGANLRADFLKVAHHGSASSSSERVLDLIQPRLAVVSSGRGNPFGHPAEVVVSRLDARGVQTLRTDQGGQVVVGLTVGASRRPAWRVQLPAPIFDEATVRRH